MPSYLRTPALRLAAPRLIGGLVAVILLVLGAACSSTSALDRRADDTGADEATFAAIEDGGTQLVALGPADGPIGPPPDLDVTPPGLVVTSPVHNTLVTESTFLFQGITEAGATVTAGELSTVAGEDGRWSIEITLIEGENTAVVTVTDEAGNEFHKTITVTFEKPKVVAAKEEPFVKPDETSKKQVNLDFTAWTKFGICSTEAFSKTGGEGSNDTDVLTKFKGTGVPGTKVTVTSEYGGGTAEVGGDGYWWIKVEFTEGAAEAVFTATVTSGDHIAKFRCGAI